MNTIGFISLMVAILATIALFDAGKLLLSALAFGVMICALWAWGLTYRYSPKVIIKRLKRIRMDLAEQGKPEEDIAAIDKYIQVFSKSKPEALPRWLLIVNSIVFLCAALLLTCGIVLVMK